MLWECQQAYGASANTPLVLDFGSYSMRAGWAGLDLHLHAPAA